MGWRVNSWTQGFGVGQGSLGCRQKCRSRGKLGEPIEVMEMEEKALANLM